MCSPNYSLEVRFTDDGPWLRVISSPDVLKLRRLRLTLKRGLTRVLSPTGVEILSAEQQHNVRSMWRTRPVPETGKKRHPWKAAA